MKNHFSKTNPLGPIYTKAESILQYCLFFLICSFFFVIAYKIIHVIDPNTFIDMFPDEGRIALGSIYIMKTGQFIAGIYGAQTHEPLFSYYAFIPVFKLFGFDIVVIRTAILAMGFMCALLLYRAIRTLFGAWPALACFALLLTGVPFYRIFHYFIEHSFVPIFLTSALYMFALFKERKRDLYLYLGMLLFALAYSAKTMVGVLYISVFIAWVLVKGYEKFSREQLIRAAMVFLAGLTLGAFSSAPSGILARGELVTAIANLPAVLLTVQAGLLQLFRTYSFLPVCYLAFILGYLFICAMKKMPPSRTVLFFFYVTVMLVIFYALTPIAFNVYRYAMFFPFFFIGIASCWSCIPDQRIRTAAALIVLGLCVHTAHEALQQKLYDTPSPTDTVSAKALTYFAAYPPQKSISFDVGTRWLQVYWYYAKNGTRSFTPRTYWPHAAYKEPGFSRSSKRPLPTMQGISDYLGTHAYYTTGYTYLLRKGITHYFFAHDFGGWNEYHGDRYLKGFLHYLKRNNIPFTIRTFQLSKDGKKATCIDIK